MKNFFKFITGPNAVSICLLLVLSVPCIQWVAVGYGRPYIVWYCLAQTIAGGTLFASMAWWARSGWDVRNIGYLISVGFSGFIALITGGTALLVLMNLAPAQFHRNVLTAAWLSIPLGICFGFYIQWVLLAKRG